jgi:hypothetical protein
MVGGMAGRALPSTSAPAQRRAARPRLGAAILPPQVAAARLQAAPCICMQAPSPALAPGPVPTLDFLVAYADPACAGTNLGGADAGYFGNSTGPAPDDASTGVFVRVRGGMVALEFNAAR